MDNAIQKKEKSNLSSLISSELYLEAQKAKEQKVPLLNLIASMKGVCLKRSLPESHQADIGIDISLIREWRHELTPRYPTRFIWVLRSCGTVIMPIGVGFDPGTIEYWFDMADSGTTRQAMETYLIDGDGVKAISKSKARKLAHIAPKDGLDSFDIKELELQVCWFIGAGLERGNWGMLGIPSRLKQITDWSEWRLFFQERGNTVMEDYMKAAIAKREQLLKQK